MSNVSFGMQCPSCGTTIGVQVGGGSTCPNCGTPMVPASGPNAPESLVNYVCKKCDSAFGLTVGTGPITACPQCGAPIK